MIRQLMSRILSRSDVDSYTYMTGLLQDIINHLSVKSECTTVGEYGLTVTVKRVLRLSNRVFRQSDGCW